MFVSELTQLALFSTAFLPKKKKKTTVEKMAGHGSKKELYHYPNAPAPRSSAIGTQSHHGNYEYLNNGRFW